ncbi:MAG: hypothetical protein KatS3mg028_0254 [Bacteroidia bacterium]|nr:MAG: hypothetical protein KatS3mg028_0254 [Bacteroidia bacterium]
MSWRKTIFVLVLNVLMTCFLHSQHKGKYQYRWAFFHPIAAIKVKHVYKKNLPIYQQVKQQKTLDTIENGGKLDAFRHAFFMACFAQKIHPKKLIKLGIAHEKDDVYFFRKKKKAEYADIPDSASIQMDLYNNRTGIELGRKYRKISPEQLRDTVIHYIFKEKLKTIRPLHN